MASIRTDTVSDGEMEQGDGDRTVRGAAANIVPNGIGPIPFSAGCHRAVVTIEMGIPAT